jgi:chemotaxis protein methyltransferase WspC
MTAPDFESLLRQAIGLDAVSIGSQSIARAVHDRQLACRLGETHAYWDHLQNTTSELQALIEAVVVPETWFFRDREAFVALARLALEWLSHHDGGLLRVLSLPCSTGEEPYSIVMAMLDSGVLPVRFRIDAIDVSARVIAIAVQAIYGRNSFRGGEQSFRERYFSAKPEGMRLNNDVRAQVRFRQGNLFAVGLEANAESYDVIFCRNLLIYFDRATQDRAVGLLSHLLATGGTIFVGPSETALLLSHDFISARLPLAFAFHKPGPVLRPATARPLVVTPPRRAPRQSTPLRPTATLIEHSVLAVKPAPDITNATRMADQGRLIEAAALCAAHVRAHGASAPAFYLMGLISDTGGNLSEAAQCYRKALYLDRNHSDALSHLALLLEKQGNMAAARLLRDRAERHAASETKVSSTVV